jgi:hypothetical protein
MKSALLASLILAAVAATPATAATGCEQTSSDRLDPRGRLRPVVICPNFVAPVYGPGNPPHRIDTLRTTRSWFVCQARSNAANPPFGAGRNHWWLWTQGDDHGRYGWFPANAIKIGGQEDPIPGVPPC